MLAMLLCLASFLAKIPFCEDRLFTYDAADYLRAARAGFPAQYLGSDSVSLLAFLRSYQTDPLFRQHPWGPLYERRDGAALRHYHVPLGFYLPSLLETSGIGTRGELLAIALLSSLIPPLVFGVLLFLYVRWWLALLAASFLAFSPVLVLAGTSLSPHPWFTLTAIASLFSFQKWTEKQDGRWWALLILMTALAIASLELAPLLCVTLAVLYAMFWFSAETCGRDMFPGELRRVAWSLGALLLLLVLLWPGGVWRGGYLMSYGTFIFQGLFRSSVYFKNRQLSDSIVRFGHHWLAGATLVGLLLLSVVAGFRERKSAPLFGWCLFAVLLFAQGLANGFRNPTYASHAVAVTLIAAALAIDALLSEKRQIGRAVAAGGIAWMLVLVFLGASRVIAAQSQEVRHDPDRVQGVIAELRHRFRPGTTFLVTQDPQAFLLNAPEFQFTGAADTDQSVPQPWAHLPRYYLLVDEEEPMPSGIALCGSEFLRKYHFAISCQELGP